jgi:hypothetical protein
MAFNTELSGDQMQDDGVSETTYNVIIAKAEVGYGTREIANELAASSAPCSEHSNELCGVLLENAKSRVPVSPATWFLCTTRKPATQRPPSAGQYFE